MLLIHYTWIITELLTAIIQKLQNSSCKLDWTKESDNNGTLRSDYGIQRIFFKSIVYSYGKLKQSESIYLSTECFLFSKEMSYSSGCLDTNFFEYDEECDEPQSISQNHKLSRTEEYIIHNDGSLRVSVLLTKMYNYVKLILKYTAKRCNLSYIKNRAVLIARYRLLLSNFKKFCEYSTVGWE